METVGRQMSEAHNGRRPKSRGRSSLRPSAEPAPGGNSSRGAPGNRPRGAKQIVAMPTPERLRHAPDWEENDARDRRHRVITILNPFPAAYRRGQFTDRQYAAGEKFHVH